MIYAVVLLYYRVMPSWTVIFVPLLVVLTLIATLSLGVTLSALTVFYRDFRHFVPFLSQIFMYCTPVIYPASMIPAKYHWFLSLNPMFGHRHRVPLGDSRPTLGFSELWRFPRHPP